MDLDKLSKRDPKIHALIMQSRQWLQLSASIKLLLPPNLHSHFQVACIENSVLILIASNNMASSRLRMIMPSLLSQLQQLDRRIESVQIKNIPAPPPSTKTNNLHFSEGALTAFAETAKRLQHHPKLAQALQNLVERNQK